MYANIHGSSDSDSDSSEEHVREDRSGCGDSCDSDNEFGLDEMKLIRVKTRRAEFFGCDSLGSVDARPHVCTLRMQNELEDCDTSLGAALGTVSRCTPPGCTLSDLIGLKDSTGEVSLYVMPGVKRVNKAPRKKKGNQVYAYLWNGNRMAILASDVPKYGSAVVRIGSKLLITDRQEVLKDEKTPPSIPLLWTNMNQLIVGSAEDRGRRVSPGRLFRVGETPELRLAHLAGSVLRCAEWSRTCRVDIGSLVGHASQFSTAELAGAAAALSLRTGTGQPYKDGWDRTAGRGAWKREDMSTVNTDALHGISAMMWKTDPEGAASAFPPTEAYANAFFNRCSRSQITLRWRMPDMNPLVSLTNGIVTPDAVFGNNRVEAYETAVTDALRRASRGLRRFAHEGITVDLRKLDTDAALNIERLQDELKRHNSRMIPMPRSDASAERRAIYAHRVNELARQQAVAKMNLITAIESAGAMVCGRLHFLREKVLDHFRVGACNIYSNDESNERPSQAIRGGKRTDMAPAFTVGAYGATSSDAFRLRDAMQGKVDVVFYRMAPAEAIVGSYTTGPADVVARVSRARSGHERIAGTATPGVLASVSQVSTLSAVGLIHSGVARAFTSAERFMVMRFNTNALIAAAQCGIPADTGTRFVEVSRVPGRMPHGITGVDPYTARSNRLGSVHDARTIADCLECTDERPPGLKIVGNSGDRRVLFTVPYGTDYTRAGNVLTHPSVSVGMMFDIGLVSFMEAADNRSRVAIVSGEAPSEDVQRGQKLLRSVVDGTHLIPEGLRRLVRWTPSELAAAMNAVSAWRDDRMATSARRETMRLLNEVLSQRSYELTLLRGTRRGDLTDAVRGLDSRARSYAIAYSMDDSIVREMSRDMSAVAAVSAYRRRPRALGRSIALEERGYEYDSFSDRSVAGMDKRCARFTQAKPRKPPRMGEGQWRALPKATSIRRAYRVAAEARLRDPTRMEIIQLTRQALRDIGYGGTARRVESDLERTGLIPYRGAGGDAQRELNDQQVTATLYDAPTEHIGRLRLAVDVFKLLKDPLALKAEAERALSKGDKDSAAACLDSVYHFSVIRGSSQALSWYSELNVDPLERETVEINVHMHYAEMLIADSHLRGSGPALRMERVEEPMWMQQTPEFPDPVRDLWDWLDPWTKCENEWHRLVDGFVDVKPSDLRSSAEVARDVKEGPTEDGDVETGRHPGLDMELFEGLVEAGPENESKGGKSDDNAWHISVHSMITTEWEKLHPGEGSLRGHPSSCCCKPCCTMRAKASQLEDEVTQSNKYAKGTMAAGTLSCGNEMTDVTVHFDPDAECVSMSAALLARYAERRSDGWWSCGGQLTVGNNVDVVGCVRASISNIGDESAGKVVWPSHRIGLCAPSPYGSNVNTSDGELAGMIQRGCSTRKIADALGVSLSEVREALRQTEMFTMRDGAAKVLNGVGRAMSSSRLAASHMAGAVRSAVLSGKLSKKCDVSALRNVITETLRAGPAGLSEVFASLPESSHHVSANELNAEMLSMVLNGLLARDEGDPTLPTRYRLAADVQSRGDSVPVPYTSSGSLLAVDINLHCNRVVILQVGRAKSAGWMRLLMLVMAWCYVFAVCPDMTGYSNGVCTDTANNAACGWDDGDCCDENFDQTSCTDNPANPSLYGCCKDPTDTKVLDNAQAIANQAASIAANTGGVATGATERGTMSVQVNSLSTAAVQRDVAIQANTDALTANTNGDTARGVSVDANTAGRAVNTASIATNAAGINSNAAGISANTATAAANGVTANSNAADIANTNIVLTAAGNTITQIQSDVTANDAADVIQGNTIAALQAQSGAMQTTVDSAQTTANTNAALLNTMDAQLDAAVLTIAEMRSNVTEAQDDIAEAAEAGSFAQVTADGAVATANSASQMAAAATAANTAQDTQMAELLQDYIEMDAALASLLSDLQGVNDTLHGLPGSVDHTLEINNLQSSVAAAIANIATLQQASALLNRRLHESRSDSFLTQDVTPLQFWNSPDDAAAMGVEITNSVESVSSSCTSAESGATPTITLFSVEEPCDGPYMGYQSHSYKRLDCEEKCLNGNFDPAVCDISGIIGSGYCQATNSTYQCSPSDPPGDCVVTAFCYDVPDCVLNKTTLWYSNSVEKPRVLSSTLMHTYACKQLALDEDTGKASTSCSVSPNDDGVVFSYSALLSAGGSGIVTSKSGEKIYVDPEWAGQGGGVVIVATNSAGEDVWTGVELADGTSLSIDHGFINFWQDLCDKIVGASSSFDTYEAPEIFWRLSQTILIVALCYIAWKVYAWVAPWRLVYPVIACWRSRSERARETRIIQGLSKVASVAAAPAHEVAALMKAIFLGKGPLESDKKNCDEAQCEEAALESESLLKKQPLATMESVRKIPFEKRPTLYSWFSVVKDHRFRNSQVMDKGSEQYLEALVNYLNSGTSVHYMFALVLGLAVIPVVAADSFDFGVVCSNTNIDELLDRINADGTRIQQKNVLLKAEPGDAACYTRELELADGTIVTEMAVLSVDSNQLRTPTYDYYLTGDVQAYWSSVVQCEWSRYCAGFPGVREEPTEPSIHGLITEPYIYDNPRIYWEESAKADEGSCGSTCGPNHDQDYCLGSNPCGFGVCNVSPRLGREESTYTTGGFGVTGRDSRLSLKVYRSDASAFGVGTTEPIIDEYYRVGDKSSYTAARTDGAEVTFSLSLASQTTPTSPFCDTCAATRNADLSHCLVGPTAAPGAVSSCTLIGGNIQADITDSQASLWLTATLKPGFCTPKAKQSYDYPADVADCNPIGAALSQIASNTSGFIDQGDVVGGMVMTCTADEVVLQGTEPSGNSMTILMEVNSTGETMMEGALLTLVSPMFSINKDSEVTGAQGDMAECALELYLEDANKLGGSVTVALGDASSPDGVFFNEIDCMRITNPTAMVGAGPTFVRVPAICSCEVGTLKVAAFTTQTGSNDTAVADLSYQVHTTSYAVEINSSVVHNNAPMGPGNAITDAMDGDEEPGLSDVAIGVIVGVSLVVVIILAVVFVYCYCKQKTKLTKKAV